ncbi:hypothetical protein [Brevundimonas sp.]|jgi:hypothetical protein|uniref:hypothetical protein n=1 Tax=Brevundimonas sp. TaxID=1871086 RepID=UPI002E162B72|nr:hypothetical protein [Brevundimonas sp.]
MTAEETRLPLPLRIGGGVLLALAGAAIGALIGRATEAQNLPWDDALNLLIAAMLLGMSGAMVFVMASRPASVPKGCGVLQIAVTALAGVMLLIPLYATRWVSADVAFLALVVVLAIQTVANVMLWRRADEMLRNIMVETGSLAFWSLQLALFLYATAERLGLISGVTAWGMIGVMMGVYLLASIVISARRGIK